MQERVLILLFLLLSEFRGALKGADEVSEDGNFEGVAVNHKRNNLKE